MLAIADLIRHRWATERLVEHAATATMPTASGDSASKHFQSTLDGSEHVALVLGDQTAACRSDSGVLIRVHSECLTGDAFGSLRCDCGVQLEQAMRAIADHDLVLGATD